ncbi:GlsB/YeaQ/YmgE family stress response membrane protein [Qaidamihabitans albus]|uniref:GlsB/YeaQ/YmgE family stress response membrane protein n=1 Tax=Qaidamihabitans albus TaxID=2795733 RepID=UPI0018F1ED8D|nr:GlsB/YeaQ/YmgE family stress response membrane protein [Qaidamihabitans albus]
MAVSGIISAILIGLVLGVLGRLVAPGKQNIPIWLTILVGIAAAFVGTAIARGIGYADTDGWDWLEFITQLVVAGVGVSLAAGMYSKGGSRKIKH